MLERLVLTSSHDVLSECSFEGSKHRTVEKAELLSDNKPVFEGEDESIPLLKEALEQTEREILFKALRKYRNLRRIGQVLGISHTAVLRKLKKYQ